MNKIVGLVLGLGLACAANAALISGETIYVDFGATAAVGDYNQIYSSQMSVADCVATNGDSTGVTLTVVAVGSATDPVADTSTVAGNALNTTDSDLYGDGIAANDQKSSENSDIITITFTGLNADLTYDLTGGYAGSSPANFDTGWTVEDQAETTYARSDATTTAGYISFTGLTVTDSGDGTGTLTITLDDNDNMHAAVSQLSLTAIPEPATIGMLGLGTVGLLAFRRRMM